MLNGRVISDFSWKEAWDMILRAPTRDLFGVSEGSDFIRQWFIVKAAHFYYSYIPIALLTFALETAWGLFQPPSFPVDESCRRGTGGGTGGGTNIGASSREAVDKKAA